MKREYVYQSELYGLEGRPVDPLARHHLPNHPAGDASSSGKMESGGAHHGPQWGLLTLSQPITASEVTCCTAAHHMLCLSTCTTSGIVFSCNTCLVSFSVAYSMLQPVGASCRMAHVFMRAEGCVKAAWGSS